MEFPIQQSETSGRVRRDDDRSVDPGEKMRAGVSRRVAVEWGEQEDATGATDGVRDVGTGLDPGRHVAEQV